MRSYIERLSWNDGRSDYKSLLIKHGYYHTGSRAWRLYDSTGSCISVVSTNLESDYKQLTPAKDCFWIKNYSECRGLGEALVAAGVVERTGRATAYFGPYDASADEYRFTPEYEPEDQQG